MLVGQNVGLQFEVGNKPGTSNTAADSLSELHEEGELNLLESASYWLDAGETIREA